MLKLDNFTAAQILREIKFWQIQTFLAILNVLNIDIGNFEQFFKSQIYQNSKLEVSEIVKMAIFVIQVLSKLISHKFEYNS